MSSRAARAATLLAMLGATASAPAQERAWSFRVDLDGSPIGHHRFTLREDAGGRELVTQARFTVKVLGITAYRYAHDATERWRGDCLEQLTAHTDDDGKRAEVTARKSGARVAVSGSGGRRELDACVMTFAYWNPAILTQKRLLNTQTGEYEAVSVREIGRESITVRGSPVEASRYRITGTRHPIDLWYSAQNEWLALESPVDGGRRLRYTPTETRTVK